jgi:hypothetical protein
VEKSRLNGGKRGRRTTANVRVTAFQRQPLRPARFFATLMLKVAGLGASTMRYARACIFAFAVLGTAGFATAAGAQQPGTSDRDCQTIRSCNFGRGGVYRGCLSSYSCRVCRFVAAPCYVDGSRKVCQRMRCTWG